MILLSVVVPTYNRLSRLMQVIAALERQTYPIDQFEVVVVSDGSTDGTHDYLDSLQHTSPLHIQPIVQSNSGPASARNNGIRHAQGDYVLFIDDDVVSAPQLVAEHMRLQTSRENLVVLGPMLTPADFTLAPWVAWEQAMLEKQYAAMQAGDWKATARQFFTGNTSVPRQLLLQSGGFNEYFRRAEDIELGYRLEQHGAEFVFTIEPAAYHYAERSFSSWLKIPYAYGRNDVIFARSGQGWIPYAVREEFGKRHLLIRAVVHTCLGRPILSNAVLWFSRPLAWVSYFAGIKWLSRMVYSAMYGLRYYQGLADELGGRKKFYQWCQQ
jgi:glycosyltransferase involved in cell wall biosynthesis